MHKVTNHPMSQSTPMVANPTPLVYSDGMTSTYALEPMTDDDAIFSDEDSLAEAAAVGTHDQEGLGYSEYDAEAYDEMVWQDEAGLR